eukprot:242393-Chlamydomonas_euryale.AAC.2
MALIASGPYHCAAALVWHSGKDHWLQEPFLTCILVVYVVSLFSRVLVGFDMCCVFIAVAVGGIFSNCTLAVARVLLLSAFGIGVVERSHTHEAGKPNETNKKHNETNRKPNETNREPKETNRKPNETNRKNA